MMTYAVTIVTCNSETFLDDVLRRCWGLTAAPKSVVIVDNASSDATMDIIAHHQHDHRELMVLRNPSNLGFTRGQNKAIQLAARAGVEALLLLNPDALLEPEYARVLLEVLQDHTSAGSATGKLLRFEQGTSVGREIIDTTGIVIHRSLAATDRGAGQRDHGQFEVAEEVFGVSAAAALYRTSALEDIALSSSVFDESFGSYKEDVDVAWRLRRRGWENWYHPDAVAYHYRCQRGGDSLRQRLRGRRQRSAVTRRMSYANHFRIMLRDVPCTFLLRFAPWIVIREFAIVVYLLLREPTTLLGIVDVVWHLPLLLRQRAAIAQRSVCNGAMLVRWMSRCGPCV